jgi:hypothetical protein
MSYRIPVYCRLLGPLWHRIRTRLFKEPVLRPGRTARRFGAPLTPRLARRRLCGEPLLPPTFRRRLAGVPSVRRGALRWTDSVSAHFSKRLDLFSS